MSTSTLFFLFLLSLAISTSNAIPAQTVNQICSKAFNKDACLRLLKSDPGVAKSDLKGVGGIVLSAANSKASQTKSVVSSLAAKAGNPELKKRYSECANFYEEVIGEIGDAKRALAANDAPSMNQHTSSAQTYVGDCRDSWSGPPQDPSDLPQRNKDVFDTLNIALIVSSLL